MTVSSAHLISSHCKSNYQGKKSCDLIHFLNFGFLYHNISFRYKTITIISTPQDCGIFRMRDSFHPFTFLISDYHVTTKLITYLDGYNQFDHSMYLTNLFIIKYFTSTFLIKLPDYTDFAFPSFLLL